MIKKWMGVCVMVCLGSALVAAPLPEGTLAQKIQDASPRAAAHFKYMRYYPPSTQIAQEPGWWEQWFSSNSDDQHRQALAVYLFNMFVLSRSYRPAASPVLDLNALGVLDGFMLCREPFDFEQAGRFYRENYEQVHAWLTHYLHQYKGPGPAPKEQEYTRWVELLAAQPQRAKQVFYTWPASERLHVPVAEPVKQKLVPFIRQAGQLGKQQVVVYDEPDLSLDNFDHRIGNNRAYRKRTYRWAGEECYYSSYLTARLLSAAGVANPKQWPGIRIYLLTVVPKNGEFLKSAQAERFTLADGQKSLAWRYHTAVLVIMPYGGDYVSVVLDSFLGGNEPVALHRWLEHFKEQPLIKVVPFRRNEITENALKIPQKTEGTTVWVDGTAYRPAPVVR